MKTLQGFLHLASNRLDKWKLWIQWPMHLLIAGRTSNKLQCGGWHVKWVTFCVDTISRQWMELTMFSRPGEQFTPSLLNGHCAAAVICALSRCFFFFCFFPPRKFRNGKHVFNWCAFFAPLENKSKCASWPKYSFWTECTKVCTDSMHTATTSYTRWCFLNVNLKLQCEFLATSDAKTFKLTTWYIVWKADLQNGKKKENLLSFLKLHTQRRKTQVSHNMV